MNINEISKVVIYNIAIALEFLLMRFGIKYKKRGCERDLCFLSTIIINIIAIVLLQLLS